MMGRRSVQVGTILGSLSESIDAAVELLSRLVFEVSVCKLRAERPSSSRTSCSRTTDVAMLVATVERVPAAA